MVKKPHGTDEKMKVRHSINPPIYLQQIRQTPYEEIRGLRYNGSLFSPTSAEQHLYSSTMEFPHTWEVLQAELMETFTAPDSADVTAQLLAQLRPTGRILDGFQLVLGGTRIQEAEVDLGSLVPATAFNNYKLRFQFWPRDICIRRNMLSSSWIDAPAHICSNESTVHDETGAEVHPAEFMMRLDECADYEPEGAAFRWAVTVGEDGTLRLQLQGLPAAAVILSGRHQFKGLVHSRNEDKDGGFAYP
jgi:hypothetical protein